jgi:endonuclease/exonuclease/phosphatase family metal-dependent hydrolase
MRNWIRLIVVATLALSLSCSKNQDAAPRNNTSSAQSNPTGSITIASFNALHLGWNNEKDIAGFCKVVAAFDVVALEEVMKPEALNTVVDELAKQTSVPWNYVVNDHALGRTTYKEYYAIVYRTDRTSYVDSTAKTWEDTGDQFEREPFSAMFRSGNFDYILIVAHTDFDSKSKEVMRNEARLLANVFSTIQDVDPHENDIILLGDFNLAADDEGWETMNNIETMTRMVSSDLPTTITKKGNLSKQYDNIWFQKKYTGLEYTDTSGVDYYYERMFPDAENPIAEAWSKISDHVPVYAKFSVIKKDDD